MRYLFIILLSTFIVAETFENKSKNYQQSSILLDKTISPRGEVIFQKLQLKIGKLPRQSVLLVVEERQTPFQTSQIKLYCNQIQIGGITINHRLNNTIEESVLALLYQIEGYRKSPSNRFSQDLHGNGIN